MKERDEPFDRFLERRAAEINSRLEQLVPPETAPPQQLHRAMRYSLFAGGKRIRPILVLIAGEAFNGKTDQLMPAACAIEMIHTYSLIHDDLPAMDNDDLRRGRPTCHKVFGEGAAILTGDALLTLAFRVLASEPADLNAERRLRVIREIAHAAGTLDGLIGGQVVDLDSEGKAITPATLDYIHRSKTGAMISVSAASGAILAGAGDEEVEKMRGYGQRIGLAFQIADDILDVTSTSEQLGKTAGKDQVSRKATYPSIHGIGASEARARELVGDAIDIVSGLSVDTTLLTALAEFIIARRS